MLGRPAAPYLACGQLGHCPPAPHPVDPINGAHPPHQTAEAANSVGAFGVYFQGKKQKLKEKGYLIKDLLREMEFWSHFNFDCHVKIIFKL